MYYALSLNAQSLSGNIYLNTTLLGLVEIPGIAIGAVLIAWKYTGRRYTVSMSMVIAGLTSFILVVLVLKDGKKCYALY